MNIHKPKENHEIEISCGIVPVFIDAKGEREYLIVKTAGYFSFPKGHLEVGETFLETARRELKEETGLECNKIFDDFMMTEEYIRKDIGRKKIVHYFIGLVESKEVIIQVEELSDYFWGNEYEVLDKLSFESAKEIFRKSLNFLKDK